MRLGSKRFLALAFFTALLIVLVNFAWWVYYQRTEKLLERQLSRRLQSLAQSIAATLPPSLVDSLATADLDLYTRVVDHLEDLRAADSLADVFVLDDSYSYLVTTSTEQDSVYFLADLNGQYIDSLFFTFTNYPVVTPAYRTGSLYLKSAFAPLVGEDASVAAVLGVEASVDYFDDLESLRRNLQYATGISTLGGFILGLLFLALQQRLNRAEQQLFLGQTHAYLGRMVAVVSHELKNPLMIIRGSAERLVKKTGAEEASYILEETDRLNTIVSGYLAFARADGPLLQGESVEQFDLAELVRSIAKHVEERFAGEQIIWIDPLPDGAIPITGYRRSLRQVILNLLVNGVEACTSGGKPIRIGITIDQREADRIAVRIADLGPGIAKKELRNIFTPFYTTKQAGSGLGLYVSRKLIEEMGGKLELRTQSRGEGVTVTLDLPRQAK